MQQQQAQQLQQQMQQQLQQPSEMLRAPCDLLARGFGTLVLRYTGVLSIHARRQSMRSIVWWTVQLAAKSNVLRPWLIRVWSIVRVLRPWLIQVVDCAGLGSGVEALVDPGVVDRA
eukprot:585411-Prorocentrum_minimum.AAC.1